MTVIGTEMAGDWSGCECEDCDRRGRSSLHKNCDWMWFRTL